VKMKVEIQVRNNKEEKIRDRNGMRLKKKKLKKK